MKPIIAFSRNIEAKDNHRYTCKECDKATMDRYLRRVGKIGRERRKKDAKTRRKRNLNKDREYQAKYRLSHTAKGLIRHAKRRTLLRGRAFNLDLYESEIQKRVDRGVCELTELPLSFVGGRTFNSPSLDRIDSKGGYTYDNIRIVCHAMNCALGDWGETVLYDVVKEWMKRR